MTLNELNITGVPVMALILRYSPNSLALKADYVTLKIDLVVSAEYRLQLFGSLSFAWICITTFTSRETHSRWNNGL